MCTASWMHADGELTLYFSRDEQRTRTQAQPPTLHKGKVSYLAPTDQDAGGTWISANAYGVVLCLLNYYDAKIQPNFTPERSRGLLLKDLAESKNLLVVMTVLSITKLQPYAPFHLLALNHKTAQLFTWDGQQLTQTNPVTAPVSTSSVKTDEVIAYRKKVFSKLSHLSSEQLEHYHHTHNAAQPAHSVNMERSDAHTVSLTRVVASAEGVEMDYWAKQSNTTEFENTAHSCELAYA